MKTLLTNIRIETGYLTQDNFTYGTATKGIAIIFDAGVVTDVLDDEVKINKAKLTKNIIVIDGQNNLLLPQLREMHVHFDKSKLGIPWTPIEPVKNRIERFEKEFDYLKKAPLSFTQRMENLLNLELSYGVTHFRSHIDIHPAVGQKSLEAAKKVLENYHDKLDYELVAFPQHGLLLSNAFSEMKSALQNGATLVGGVDPISIDGNLEKSLNQTFELATQFHAPIDYHLHERHHDARQTFAKFLSLIEETNWQGKVTISHAYGLRDLPKEERKELFAQLAKNKVTIISSIPLDFVIPPLIELKSAGVKTFIGNDNIYDCWSPFGSGDVIDKLNRYAEIFDLTSQKELTESLELVTNQKLITPAGWIKEGMPADFTLVNASSTAEFVARRIPVAKSYFKGQQVK
ncbi:amidohydrolase family protein [Enterococcus canintestini]|uniref:Amidohydrolase 3 domain-containing protein n=1 Tax=Enterococcus canintestini TaxID=317010 RepID=A0A1L8R9F6_9ENTE|nr:amidohydrolase family protein [Enterococcus canintestini]OJG16366.1 hypothetical protein RU96_GL001108 [Enterococcus canintestini]